MNEVEKVKEICKGRGIAISKLEKDCGFCNGYIGGLKKGVFPSDRLMKIANYLDIPLNELSQTAAAMPVDYIVKTDNETEIRIGNDVKEALEGPYKDLLIAYAKKLNELRKLEEEP
jgi:transcriptional regulator with XRE-family HTH domain